MAQRSATKREGAGAAPTSADVARLAGVSRSTISLVLNGQADQARISEETRNRVLSVAARLGYTPNHAARSLRRRSTRVIAFVLPTLDNPYFSEVLTAAQQYAQAKGYTLVVVPAGGEPAQAITALQGGAYDGVILAGRATCSAPEVMELTRRGLATIVLQEHSPDSTLPSVRVDLEEGGYLATRHLIQLGHTRIAHVTEALPQQRSRPGRLEGYRLALREAALPFDPALVLIAPNSMEGGCEAIRTLLEMKRSRRPTAAFMYNDLMAFGALREARRHRVDVPRDLAIVGFDGVAMGQYTVPMLTTIDHPRAALGVAAIETLIDVINGNPLRTERLLPVELVIRESCGGAAHQQASHPLSTGRTKGSTRM